MLSRLTTVAVVGLLVLVGPTPVGAETSYALIRGEGSPWAAALIESSRAAVRVDGMTVDYTPSGSTAGRKNFLNGTVDFAVSDVPFQSDPEDGSAPENPAPGSFAYVPVTAGGTAFTYNLSAGGTRITNLRLSGETAAKIFTRAITRWNDPAIAADNPGIRLPDREIVPVVRSDGAGTTTLLTDWLATRHSSLWADLCRRAGRNPCEPTAFFPQVTGMVGQAGDVAVSGYVAQAFADGAIGYVNASYAQAAQLPVAKVLNAAGYYTAPSPSNVAVSLLAAEMVEDETDPTRHLTHDLHDVYSNSDPRTYELSSYSYLIVRTAVGGVFTEEKGRTLAAFGRHLLCDGQGSAPPLGYAPLPRNLVEAGIEQLRRIPGADLTQLDVRTCANPTFASDGTNLVLRDAQRPLPCDRRGPVQCGGPDLFRDDGGNVHEASINAIAGAGITLGCGADTFCPAATVTRAQMATLVVKTLEARGIGIPDLDDVDAFDDDDGSVHEDAIDVLWALGFVDGTAPRRFSPDAPVSRGQMAAFLARSLRLPAAVWDAFDDDAGNVHASAIDRVAIAGLTGGCAARRYCPSDPIRRDQLATFLYRTVLPPPPNDVYEGRGTQAVPIAKPLASQPTVAVITHEGTGAFTVTERTASGGRGPVVVNDGGGGYRGTLLLDAPPSTDGDTVALEVVADGLWRIELLPLAAVRSFDRKTEGTGDGVVGYTGAAGTIRIRHSGQGRIAVRTYGETEQILVDATGTHDSTKPLSAGPRLIVVTADGGWSLSTSVAEN